jgi:hypothetical protein
LRLFEEAVEEIRCPYRSAGAVFQTLASSKNHNS